MPGSKITRLEHYQSIENQTGQPLEELDGPDIPEIASHIWQWFMDLSAARQGGPISYSEIEAWSRLTDTKLQPWEVRALKIIDIEYIKSNNHG